MSGNRNNIRAIPVNQSVIIIEFLVQMKRLCDWSCKRIALVIAATVTTTLVIVLPIVLIDKDEILDIPGKFNHIKLFLVISIIQIELVKM